VQAGVVAAVVTTLAFFLIQLAPGDPFDWIIERPGTDPALADSLRAQFGLDRPIAEQYVRYVANVARGDLGRSFVSSQPAATVIREALPNTLLLMGTALALSFLLGVSLGVAQATRPGSLLDRGSRGISLAFYSVPDFWLAALVLILFAGRLRWLPPGGGESIFASELDPWPRLVDRARHLVLPALTLVLLTTAAVARFQRAALLDTMSEDYVRTAVAKGLSPRAAVLRHALRNALLPVVTLLGLALPALLGGAVFVERVFSWPGMGSLLVNAVTQRDYFVLTGCVLVGSLMVVAGSLLADLLALAVDPRQREA
jgi:peptide/nickel transport system permease protein